MLKTGSGKVQNLSPLSCSFLEKNKKRRLADVDRHLVPGSWWVWGSGPSVPRGLPWDLFSSHGPSAFPCLSLSANPSHTFDPPSLPPKMPGSIRTDYCQKLFWLWNSWHIFIRGYMAIFNAALKNNPTNILIPQSMAYISSVISSLLSGALSQAFYSSHNLDLWVTMYNK